MDKFKTSLLAALGVMIVMLTIMLFSSLKSISQSSPLSIVKNPFQVLLIANGASQGIPAGNIFVVENVDIKYYPGSEIGDVVINTTSGGVNGFHCIDSQIIPGTMNTMNRNFNRSSPVHFYIDANSGIGASTEGKSDKVNITLSGYLTKSL